MKQIPRLPSFEPHDSLPFSNAVNRLGPPSTQIASNPPSSLSSVQIDEDKPKATQRSLMNSASTLADSQPSTNRETAQEFQNSSVGSQSPRHETTLNTSTYLGMNEPVCEIVPTNKTQGNSTDLDRVEPPAWGITRGSAFGAASVSDAGSHGAITLHPLNDDDYIFSKNNVDDSPSSVASSDHEQAPSSPSQGANDRASADRSPPHLPNSKELPSASPQGSSIRSSSLALEIAQSPEHQLQIGSKDTDTSAALSGNASIQDGEFRAVSAIIDSAFRSLNSGLETPVSADVPDTASTSDLLTGKITVHENHESSWQGHQGDSSQPSSEHLAVSPLRLRSSESQVSDISREDEESSNAMPEGNPEDNPREPRASDSDPLTLHPASDTSTLEQQTQMLTEYRTSSEGEAGISNSFPDDIEKFGQQIIQENHPPLSQLPSIHVSENSQVEAPDEPPPPFTSIDSNFSDVERQQSERSPPYTPLPASRLSEVNPIRGVPPGHLSLLTKPPQAPPMHQIVEHLPAAPDDAIRDPTVPRRFYSQKPSFPRTVPAGTNRIQTSPGVNSRPMQLQREQSHQRNYNPTIPSPPVHTRSQSKDNPYAAPDVQDSQYQSKGNPYAARDVQDSQHPAFRTDRLRSSSPIRWAEGSPDTAKSRVEGQGLAATRNNILNSLSRPDTDSLGSRESTKVHTGTSHPDLQFEQSSVNPLAPSTSAEDQSSRGKLRRIGRFQQRFSSSSIPTVSAESTKSEASRSEGAKKRSAFSRLSVYRPYVDVFLV
jgi:hypothetical protein